MPSLTSPVTSALCESRLVGTGHRSRAPYASPDSCRDGLRLTDRWSQLTCHEPHLFFACAPQPPDSRFSPLLGAIGATASIDGIVVAAAPRRGGGAFANNR